MRTSAKWGWFHADPGVESPGWRAWQPRWAPDAEDERSGRVEIARVRKSAGWPSVRGSTACGRAVVKLPRLGGRPVEQRDREALTEWCVECGVTLMAAVTPRTTTRVAGEVRSVRVAPKATWPALEVVVGDGTGTVTAVFLGRDAIAGINPGTRLEIEGLIVSGDGRLETLNPVYTLR